MRVDHSRTTDRLVVEYQAGPLLNCRPLEAGTPAWGADTHPLCPGWPTVHRGSPSCAHRRHVGHQEHTEVGSNGGGQREWRLPSLALRPDWPPNAIVEQPRVECIALVGQTIASPLPRLPPPVAPFGLAAGSQHRQWDATNSGPTMDLEGRAAAVDRMRRPTTGRRPTCRTIGSRSGSSSSRARSSHRAHVPGRRGTHHSRHAEKFIPITFLVESRLTLSNAQCVRGSVKGSKKSW